MIRLFVGTDQRMGVAERALENSIVRNCSQPVDVTWMRAGDPGWSDWNIGREPGNPYSGRGWATDFSCFRFAVPALCGYKGRAIYLDVDMLTLGDLAELWEWPLTKPIATVGSRFDVVVFDCERFADGSPWPSLEGMRASGYLYSYYSQTLRDRGRNPLPGEWDCLDGRGLSADTKLLHFTNMRTQPWQPWPDVFPYDEEHPSPEAVKLFWQYAEED